MLVESVFLSVRQELDSARVSPLSRQRPVFAQRLRVPLLVPVRLSAQTVTSLVFAHSIREALLSSPVARLPDDHLPAAAIENIMFVSRTLRGDLAGQARKFSVASSVPFKRYGPRLRLERACNVIAENVPVAVFGIRQTTASARIAGVYGEGSHFREFKDHRPRLWCDTGCFTRSASFDDLTVTAPCVHAGCEDL